MAPITGLSATSSTRPLLSARNSAASNNRLHKAVGFKKVADGGRETRT